MDFIKEKRQTVKSSTDIVVSSANLANVANVAQDFIVYPTSIPKLLTDPLFVQFKEIVPNADMFINYFKIMPMENVITIVRDKVNEHYEKIAMVKTILAGQFDIDKEQAKSYLGWAKTILKLLIDGVRIGVGLVSAIGGHIGSCVKGCFLAGLDTVSEIIFLILDIMVQAAEVGFLFSEAFIMADTKLVDLLKMSFVKDPRNGKYISFYHGPKALNEKSVAIINEHGQKSEFLVAACSTAKTFIDIIAEIVGTIVSVAIPDDSSIAAVIIKNLVSIFIFAGRELPDLIGSNIYDIISSIYYLAPEMMRNMLQNRYYCEYIFGYVIDFVIGLLKKFDEMTDSLGEDVSIDNILSGRVDLELPKFSVQVAILKVLKSQGFNMQDLIDLLNVQMRNTLSLSVDVVQIGASLFFTLLTAIGEC